MYSNKKGNEMNTVKITHPTATNRRTVFVNGRQVQGFVQTRWVFGGQVGGGNSTSPRWTWEVDGKVRGGPWYSFKDVRRWFETNETT